MSPLTKWRRKGHLIIALAIPVTFSFTLMINLLLGYTINRVTLFALILSLGLVVDDPIVDVENIHRHFAMRTEPPFKAVMSPDYPRRKRCWRSRTRSGTPRLSTAAA